MKRRKGKIEVRYEAALKEINEVKEAADRHGKSQVLSALEEEIKSFGLYAKKKLGTIRKERENNRDLLLADWEFSF